LILKADSKFQQKNLNKLTFQKKSKDFKHRSSEFSKNELKIINHTKVHRHSNDLYNSKNKGMLGEHRRMYGSGLSTMDQKLKENDNLKESMTRKKITAFKVTSKNSNQDTW